jgi:hypothetical protein
VSRSAATLSTQLQAISGATEAAARVSWSAAWATYFADAISDATSFTTNPTHIATARAAMEAALVGFSVTDQGATKIQAGIIAWWDAIVANPGNFFSGSVTATKPAGLTSIAANMQPILTTNKNNASSAAVACGAIATQIHSDNAGGTTNLGPIF